MNKGQATVDDQTRAPLLMPSLTYILSAVAATLYHG